MKLACSFTQCTGLRESFLWSSSKVYVQGLCSFLTIFCSKITLTIQRTRYVAERLDTFSYPFFWKKIRFEGPIIVNAAKRTTMLQLNSQIKHLAENHKWTETKIKTQWIKHCTAGVSENQGSSIPRRNIKIKPTIKQILKAFSTLQRTPRVQGDLILFSYYWLVGHLLASIGFVSLR